MLQHLPFVARNAVRNRRRSILTIISVAVSLCLLGMLLALYRQLFTRMMPRLRKRFGWWYTIGCRWHSRFPRLIKRAFDRFREWKQSLRGNGLAGCIKTRVTQRISSPGWESIRKNFSKFDRT